jgi:hypothetical protein
VVLSLILINGRPQKYIAMTLVNLHSDLIEVSLVVDQKMNGRKSLRGMIYRPPSEPQVHIARILINVKEKNTMSEKKEEEQNRKTDRVVNIVAIISAILAGILWLFGGGNQE